MLRSSVLRALLFACIAIAGCGPVMRVATVRAASARDIMRLERLTQRELQCRMPLRVTSLDAGAYALDGCGVSREYAHVCMGRRCTFQPILPAILRAASDLGCAPEMLQAAAQSATHRAYFGCSRGAAYMLVCVQGGCAWTRTNETVSVAVPASAPTLAPAPVPAPAPMPTYAPVDPSLADVPIPPPPGAAPSTPAAAPPTADAVVVPPPPS